MKSIILALSLLCFLSLATADIKKVPSLETFQALADEKLTEKNDLERVKKALLDLIVMDEFDPSRTGAAILADSYGKHTELYKKAAQQIETKDNKKTLKEIIKVMKNLNENGNG